MSGTALDNWKSNPEEDHGPLMSGCIWGLWTISTLFVCLRVHVRLRHARIWWDDAVLLLGWIALLVQCILNQVAIGMGFGKHALDVDATYLDKITVVGAVGLTISIVAINASKISFAITLIPLTKGWARYYIYFAIFTLVAFAVPVAVAPWTQCRPLVKTFIDFYPGECVDKRPAVRFGIFQAIWAALVDISLALLPWKILWNLQMRMPEKIGVMLAMSLGLLAGATAIIRSLYIQQLANMDLSYDAVDTVVWSVTESTATIIAASIPVLRKFLKEKINSAVTYVQQGSTGRSKRSEQRTVDQSKGARKSIHLSDLSSKATSSKPRSRTYSELDDLDDKSERSILREREDQSQQNVGLKMPPPVGLAS